MKRRDVLLLRPTRHARLVELPCGRLYMRYLEARAGGGKPEGDRIARPDDPQDGEPPLELDTRTPDELFATLAEELRTAEVVRLLDRAWLAEAAFKHELDRVLDAFRARGGRIELPDEQT